MKTYWMTRPAIDDRLIGRTANIDWTPTLHYYGTLEVSLGAGEDAEDLGLVEWSVEDEQDEADSLRLYRNEMRIGG